MRLAQEEPEPDPYVEAEKDVDDLDDLGDALALGVGPRTAERAASL